MVQSTFVEISVFSFAILLFISPFVSAYEFRFIMIAAMWLALLIDKLLGEIEKDA